ncbi:MAG: ABC transporter permease [Clostridiales Family XIII bacterium]|jgi:NitT/TauT family transport system permease protein|nr:ABC transporter permease [Clostridiales Family XIII bacterium]
MREGKGPHLLLRLYRKTIVIIVLLVLWWILPQFIESMYFPPLGVILAEFRRNIENGELLINLYTSLRVSIIGLAVAEVLGISIGALIGWFKRVDRYLNALFQVMRCTSILALLPLFVLLFGAGELSKIIIIAWATIFPTMINTAQGVRNLEPVLVRSARSMGVRGVGLFLKIILPSASPYILAGFRLSASISLLVLVAAEMLGAAHGLGLMINDASRNFQVTRMYVGMLTIMILGVVLNAALVWLERRLTVWQERAVSA